MTLRAGTASLRRASVRLMSTTWRSASTWSGRGTRRTRLWSAASPSPTALGRGVMENKDSTDVECPPPQPHFSSSSFPPPPPSPPPPPPTHPPPPPPLVCLSSGGKLMTSTRSTLNLVLLLRPTPLSSALLRASVRAVNLKVVHALISVECLFSRTLLPGSSASAPPSPGSTSSSFPRRSTAAPPWRPPAATRSLSSTTS